MSSIRNSSLTIIFVHGVLLLLAGCGGGGGDAAPDTPPDSQVTVPAATAMANFVNQAKTSRMTINGTMTAQGQALALTGSGTLTETSGSTTFEGRSALRKQYEMSGTLSAEGYSAPFAASGQRYFDTGYQPLGSTGDGTYCVVTYANALPPSARAGDSGPWYGENCYADSTKTVGIGANSISYAFESDTGTSLLLNIIQSSADGSGAGVSDTITLRVDTAGQIAWIQDVSRGDDGAVAVVVTSTFY